MLKWSERRDPDRDCSYNHVVAETPLGEIYVEWRGWKNYDTPTAHMPWVDMGDGFVHGDDIEDAKKKVQASWDAMAQRMAALSSTSHTKEQG